MVFNDARWRTLAGGDGVPRPGDRHEDGKPYLWVIIRGDTNRRGGGKVLLVEVSLDGVRAMKSNPAVDALVVHAGVTEPATLRERLRARPKEDESTVQKRLELRARGVGDCPARRPGRRARGGRDAVRAAAAAGEVSLLLCRRRRRSLQSFKVRCAELSPIVRNRLLGLPARAGLPDVIPANETEKPVVKPVVLTGPNFLEKADLVRRVTDEFPRCSRSRRSSPPDPAWSPHPCETEPSAARRLCTARRGASSTWNTCRARISKPPPAISRCRGRRTAHETMTHKYGIRRDSLESAAADEKLCIVNLPSVEAHDAFAAFCASNEATVMPGRMKGSRRQTSARSSARDDRGTRAPTPRVVDRVRGVPRRDDGGRDPRQGGGRRGRFIRRRHRVGW